MGVLGPFAFVFLLSVVGALAAWAAADSFR